MDGEFLLLDGAFGTYCLEKTGDSGAFEDRCLSDPESVIEIHREYLRAGADAVTTNTFRVAASEMTRDSLRALIAAAWDCANTAIAREKPSAEILADIGCARDPESDSARDMLLIAREFIALGARRYLFETQPSLAPALPAISEIKRAAPGAWIAVSFAVTPDGYSASGESYIDLIEAAHATGVSAAGLNCACGPMHMKRLIEKLPSADIPVIACPNAGYPSLVNGRLAYRDNPDYFAEQLAEMRKSGARVLGGCCGTTPTHIRRAARALRGIKSVPLPKSGAERREIPVGVANPAKSGCAIYAELSPPADADVSAHIRMAKKLLAAGADIITVPDSPLARSRMDSFAFAARVARETGARVMPHLTCRDRNRVAITGALYAGAADGVSDVLAVRGDPVPRGELGDKSVYALNTHSLISFIGTLNRAALAQTPYRVAAALNLNAEGFEAELERAVKKAEAGARTIITQAIFDERALENLMKARQRLDCELIAGIMCVAGYKNAVFLNNEVHGVNIPDDFIESLRDVDAARVQEISLLYSTRLMDMAKPHCDGFYVIMPLKRVGLSAALIRHAKGYVEE